MICDFILEGTLLVIGQYRLLSGLPTHAFFSDLTDWQPNHKCASVSVSMEKVEHQSNRFKY
jgi:hypothetical protein